MDDLIFVSIVIVIHHTGSRGHSKSHTAPLIGVIWSVFQGWNFARLTGVLINQQLMK